MAFFPFNVSLDLVDNKRKVKKETGSTRLHNFESSALQKTAKFLRDVIKYLDTISFF